MRCNGLVFGRVLKNTYGYCTLWCECCLFVVFTPPHVFVLCVLHLLCVRGGLDVCVKGGWVTYLVCACLYTYAGLGVCLFLLSLLCACVCLCFLFVFFLLEFKSALVLCQNLIQDQPREECHTQHLL